MWDTTLLLLLDTLNEAFRDLSAKHQSSNDPKR